MKCDRCGEETTLHIMSRFNTENICMKCDEKEQRHPDYPRAVRVELYHTRHGNLNFEGIGKPDDL